MLFGPPPAAKRAMPITRPGYEVGFVFFLNEVDIGDLDGHPREFWGGGVGSCAHSGDGFFSDMWVQLGACGWEKE